MRLNKPQRRLYGAQVASLLLATALGLLAGCLSGASNQGTDGTATLSPTRPDPLQGGPEAVDAGDNAAAANQTLESPLVTSTFPALDANLVQGDANALLGYAAAEAGVPNTPNQSVVVRARPFECLDAHGLDTNALFVQLWPCNKSDAQAFTFLPDGHVQLAAKLPGAGSPNYCLAAAGGNDVGFFVCADEPNQLWAAGGHLLQAQVSGACLTRQDGTLSKTLLGQAPCRRDDARQAWAVGEPNALARSAAAVNPNFPVGPALPTSGQNALVGYARLFAPPATSQPLDLCLRQGLQVSFSPETLARTVVPRLSFYASAEQVVFQPDGHLETARLFKRSMPGCVGANADNATQRPTLTVVNCSNDPNLSWSVSGHNLQHTATKMCLAFDETRWTDRSPTLKPCDATDVRQSWATGQHDAMRAEAQASQEGYSVD